MRHRSLRLLAPAAVVLALVAGACGSDGDRSGGAASGGSTSSAEAVPDLTGVTMTDLSGGGEVALADALDAPPSTPVLAFFWAPF